MTECDILNDNKLLLDEMRIGLTSFVCIEFISFSFIFFNDTLVLVIDKNMHYFNSVCVDFVFIMFKKRDK